MLGSFEKISKRFRVSIVVPFSITISENTIFKSVVSLFNVLPYATLTKKLLVTLFSNFVGKT